MADFTSALYLGLDHASWSLPAWPKLSLGKPAALAEMPGACAAERHLFWDLFGMVAKPGAKIFVDQGAYVIARWGVERAIAAGATVETFPHFDARSLRNAMRKWRGVAPVIVTDGFCPGCGRVAPLREYTACAQAGGGLLVVDDTQATGILGRGGGGSLRQSGLGFEGAAVVSSLAKGFGVPVAMLAGGAGLVEDFVRSSATRVHCSPPSAAVMAAAGNAIEINRQCGDYLRRRLARRVARLRQGLRKLGLLATGSLFPVQPLRLVGPGQAFCVHEALLERGVQAVLHRSANGAAARISIVVTAKHEMDEIDEAIESLGGALARVPAIRSG